ncbi:putative transcription factor OFP family [Helianthus annuus]|nr:putative transcription factor OFP family [Helianthus annuus]KAJ0659578.1 putative transcription factor OFP family [Helianthus annuus]KAJ0853280.1 putative transcription factor OFP family [Helianthus annuus]
MGRTRTLPFLPTCGSPSKTLSFRTTTGEFDDMEPSVDDVIRGLSTDRFFFNPGTTSSILEEAKPKEKEKEREKQKEKEKESVVALKESVSMMEMDSTDPFVDFKKSMQEMVEADEGLKEWENLQELLSLYLAVNDKTNHGYIIGAFVDLLLVNLGPPSKPSLCSTSSSINATQEQSILLESGGNCCSNNNNNNNKLMMMISSESPESALSFTSSFASSSGTCSSTSHFLSSCSLEDEEEEEEEDNNGDDEDHNSPQKASVSDCHSSLKV